MYLWIPGMSFVWPVLWLYVPCRTCARLTQIHVAMDFLGCPLYGQCSGYIPCYTGISRSGYPRSKSWDVLCIYIHMYIAIQCSGYVSITSYMSKVIPGHVWIFLDVPFSYAVSYIMSYSVYYVMCNIEYKV